MANRSPVIWGAADSYGQYMGRWSRKIAPLFIDWLGAAMSKSWADIGCGTGVLSSEINARCNPSRSVGIDLSPAFIEQARARVPGTGLSEGDATNTKFQGKASTTR